jgi:hypothetical protein
LPPLVRPPGPAAARFATARTAAFFERRPRRSTVAYEPDVVERDEYESAARMRLAVLIGYSLVFG